MKKFITPLLLALFTALLAGCNSTNNVMVGLQVELTGIARAADGSTQVSWRVVNPNVVAYLVAETNHRVYLDGVLVGTITDRDAVAAPAQSKADKVSRLVSAGPAADRTLIAAAATGSAAYRVESVVVIRLYGDNTDKTNLSASGQVPVTAK